jgi:hypothetical protein
MAATQIFIVRIRRDGACFSASARRVDQEVAGQFDQPQTLLEFLVRAGATGTPGPPQGEADDPDAPP